jgi:hypothetical protein
MWINILAEMNMVGISFEKFLMIFSFELLKLETMGEAINMLSISVK